LLNAPALSDRAAVDRIEADRIHKLRHLCLGFGVVAGNGKRPALRVFRCAVLAEVFLLKMLLWQCELCVLFYARMEAPKSILQRRQRRGAGTHNLL
jgi:hypothetical protein